MSKLRSLFQDVANIFTGGGSDQPQDAETPPPSQPQASDPSTAPEVCQEDPATEPQTCEPPAEVPQVCQENPPSEPQACEPPADQPPVCQEEPAAQPQACEPASTDAPSSPSKDTAPADDDAAKKAKQEAQEDADFEKLMGEREGRRSDVYLDSLEKPTVGIGHLVTPADGLKVGDKVSDEKIGTLFKKDSGAAMGTARSQAAEAGITDPAFMAYLASVNFQLGTGWTKKFPDTWKLIKDGKYEEAAAEVAKSAWNKQTPTRVQDFQGALRKLPPKQ